MAFESGSVKVRCPLCGAEVAVPIQVEWVTYDKTQSANFAARRPGTVVASVRERNTAEHICESTNDV